MIYNVRLVSFAEVAPGLKVMVIVASVMVFCWTQLWFGYLSKFEDKIKTVLSNSFRMSLANMGRVFLLGIIGALHLFATVALFLLMPPLMVLIPGSYLLCYIRVIGKIFAKYIPQQTEQEEVPAEA